VRLERGRRLSGWIIEAEAYIGQEDLACHAHVGRTERNRVMWGEAGHAYVYFTYGMHWCLNVVTEPADRPAAVLLRALAPSEGLRTMARRRAARRDPRRAGAQRPPPGLTDGPAKLCQALDIDRRFNGRDLCASGADLFIEDGPALPAHAVRRGSRIGLERVPEPWKSKPWRFRLAPGHVPQGLEEEPA
jgi:DNA-3-methyladenine glycosylase